MRTTKFIMRGPLIRGHLNISLILFGPCLVTTAGPLGPEELRGGNGAVD